MSKDTIHDLLSIGEIESALSSNQEKQAEINRLPLFLRLLATGQPLSCVPNLMPNSSSADDKNTGTTDSLVNAVVSRLEDVAATHSAAESMDVLVSHIAPSTCRRMSKLAPLKRKAEWVTSELAATALAPLNNIRGKKSRLSTTASTSMSDTISGDSDDNLDSGDEMEDVSDRMQDLSDKHNQTKEKFGKLKRMRLEGRESLMMAGLQEDSQEAHLTRLLSELATLVVESLQPPPQVNKEDEEAPEPTLSVKADSLLSDSETATIGNDLGACIAVIMHHAPVLRHRHVASALCRASVPQAPNLIFRMGANSPNSVACLVRGCMDAIMVEEGAVGSSTEEVVSIAKAAVRRLAQLSTRESARIRGMLGCSMLDVQLELALEQDVVEAACLLTKQVARNPESTSESLKNLLQANSATVSKCYDCLLNSVETLRGPPGELKLMLRALLWLIISVDNVKSASLLSAADLLGRKLEALCDGEGEKPKTSEKDMLFGFLLCGSLVVCSLLGLVGQEGVNDGKRKDAWQGLLKKLLTVNPPSTKSNTMISRVAALLHSQEFSGLQDLIKEVLSSSRASLHEIYVQSGFTKLCKWAVINGDLDTLCNRTLIHSAVVLDPSALIQMIAARSIEVKKLEPLMREILRDPECSSKLLSHASAYNLLKESVRFLFAIDNLAVPLVSQVALSSLVRKTISSADIPATLRGQMIVNFVYALLFFSENPLSPFTFDLRDQPVVEVLKLIKDSGLEQVHQHVRSIVQKHAPDIIYEADSSNPASTTLLEVSNESELKHQDVLKLLSAALRNTLANPDVDPSGLKVERTYLLAQRHIPSSQVDCLLVSTLIALPNTPPPFLTYGMLCRDPLVLLQCPVSMWQCRGMRRVALSTLGRLLPANDNLTRRASQSEDVAEELLASRNVVLLRCLLSLASGKGLLEDSESSITKPCQCHVLTGMIRTIVANQTGLIATLIKHGLPDEVVDWLVDCVPECVNDSSALTTLLSERSPLTAAERLKTADAALRISIAFGSRDELEGKNLANACLHQLISSFYLVLGPVGVPVNALIEENGMDLTQVCRKATFRMLSALQNVRGSRIGLKNECSMALQKLAGLCKSESGMAGVGGSVANRRKALLKEIWDALVKALNAMGSGVGLN